MGELTRRDGGTVSRAGGAKPSPLAGLPDGWREKVKFFYAAYSDYFKSPVGLAAMVRYWIKEYGLTLAEADAIFRRMLSPDEVAKIQHGGQAMAALGRMVDAVVTERRRADRLAEQRRQFAASSARFDGPGRPAMPIGGGNHAV